MLGYFFIHIALLVGISTAVIAQAQPPGPPPESREEADTRGEGRGRGERGDENRRGDNRDERRLQRRRELLQRLDANRDGVVEYAEVSEDSKWIIQRIAGDAYKPGMRLTMDGQQAPATSSASAASAFGAPATPANKPPGFDAPPQQTAATQAGGIGGEQAEKYTADLMRRYDRSGNGLLEREEWIRIPGEPDKADADRDGIVTPAELRVRVAYRFSEQYKIDQQRAAPAEKQEPTDDDKKDARKSYRFLTAKERLPEGLPAYFSRDRDGDGQVSMHEFSSTWSEARARDFQRYDADADGVITPAEALKNK